jgi:AcrR family transcriptional regulator
VTTRRGPQRSSRGPELVELARSVLVDEGLDQFVLRDIAARAGMTVGNLQYYFRTRDDLLVAVIEAEFDRDLAVIRDVVASTDHGLVEIARRLVNNWCDGAGTVFTALSMLAFHHERFRQLNREIYGTFYAELGSVIRAADPEADDVEIAARSRLITAVLDGVALQIHATVCDDDACDDLLRRATEHLVDIARGRDAQNTG